MSSSLLRFARNIHSENGEDGILAEVMERLGIAQGQFCEFGAWDGVFLSNCHHLLTQGWSGVMIEGDEARYRALQHTAQLAAGRLTPICATVSAAAGPNSLDSLLAETPVRTDFDLLSIDVDGCDYQIWQRLTEYRPKVVLIEINSSFPPGIDLIHGQHPGTGSSFSATLKLGRRNGYQLVCHTGNLLFVRDEMVSRLRLEADELREPERLFVGKWLADLNVPPPRPGMRQRIGGGLSSLGRSFIARCLKSEPASEA